MFISSSAGISVVALVSIVYQTDIYAYQTNAISTIVLIITLVYQMYQICNNFLSYLVDEEQANPQVTPENFVLRNKSNLVAKIKID